VRAFFLGVIMTYFKIFNKKYPGDIRIVDEITDFIFEEGWRTLSIHNWINGEEYLQMDEFKRQFSIEQYGF
jgi:hypothetical protein